MYNIGSPKRTDAPWPHLFQSHNLTEGELKSQAPMATAAPATTTNISTISYHHRVFMAGLPRGVEVTRSGGGGDISRGSLKTRVTAFRLIYEDTRAKSRKGHESKPEVLS
jgi:hypothetical protein